MDEEKGDDQSRSTEHDGSMMKFSFTASKPKFSASRPPLFPKGKQRSDNAEGNKYMEFVTAFDEQGFVAKDPKGLRGARVIPKLENSWRPEKRMKNIVLETDITKSSDERFVKETVIEVPNSGVHYGLSVGVKKAELTVQGDVTTGLNMENGHRAEVTSGKTGLTFAQIEDQRLREDLVNLPETANMDAYEDMPIEEFGEAILRGMGWEKGKPIGRHCKVAVVPVEYVRRSGRTGLGAEPAPKDFNHNRQIKPGESRAVAQDLVASVGADGRVRNVIAVDEKLVERSRKGVIKGKFMSIISGRHLGLRGEVLNSENSDRVSVKLVRSGERVIVTSKDLADIGSVEEEKVLKQIRQLRIEDRKVSGRDDMGEDDHENFDKEEPFSNGKEDRKDGREDRKYGRKEDRKEGGREKEGRREDEERSRSRRDERVYSEEQTRINRDERRERKRDERTRDDMEVDHAGRIRSEDRRSTVRDEKREKEDERRESRRDVRREEERTQREHGRTNEDRDERGAARDRKSYSDNSYLSERRQDKGRDPSGVGIIGRDASGGLTNAGRYREAWLTSHIRIRIISKSFKGGKYYLKKARIVDVVTPKECDVLLDESGEILQHVKQDYLETALPKRGGRVMVVGGEYRGLLGKLIERDSEGEVGLVQMEESFEMTTLSLDLLAEFVGDPTERDV